MGNEQSFGTMLADIDVKTARAKLRTERIRLKAGAKLVRAAEMQLVFAKVERDYTKIKSDLESLRGQHRGECLNEYSSSSSAPSTPPPDATDAPDKPKTLMDLVQEADKRCKVASRREYLTKKMTKEARASIQELHQKILKRQSDISDVALELADLQSTHRECLREYEFRGLVEHPDQGLWRHKSLRFSAKTMHCRKRLQYFIKRLATAPCIKTLTLFLPEFGGAVPASLKLTQDALSKAPVQVKELCVTFGRSSKEAVLGLMEKTRDHLERLALTLMYDHTFTDEELCRLWRLMEASEEAASVEVSENGLWYGPEEGLGVKTLALSSPELLRSVPFPFETSRLSLERLEFGDVAKAGQPTVLPALLRAVRSTLREVRLPAALREDERAAVFAALAECPYLEEAFVPCYADMVCLQSCAKLERLGLQSVGPRYNAFAPGPSTAAAVRLLKLPALADRVRELTLESFAEQRDGAVIDAAASLKSLRRLTLGTTVEAHRLVRLVAALPSLEELHLLNGFFLKSGVLAKITPALAPKLRLLEVDCEIVESECDCPDDDYLGLGYGMGCGLPHAGWWGDVATVRNAFQKVKPDFTLKVPSGASDERDSCSSLGSDVQSDDGLEKEVLKAFDDWKWNDEEEEEDSEGSECGAD